MHRHHPPHHPSLHPQLHTAHHHRPLAVADVHADRKESLGVSISVLGGFRVVVDGVATPASGWARRSAAALVKILALAPEHRLHRERVMDLLWPGESLCRSAPRLHKAAHFARRAAGRHDAVVLSGEVVTLFAETDLTVDAVEFERLARLAVGRHDERLAREALAWYGGDLLPDDPYEEWAGDRRELLSLRRLDLLRLAGEWRDVAELAPTDEEAHVELMRRQVAAGDVGAAIRQYEHLERVLERELGAAPGAAVQRARHAATSARFDPSSSRVDELLAELAALVTRESAVLAELASIGSPAVGALPR